MLGLVIHEPTVEVVIAERELVRMLVPIAVPSHAESLQGLQHHRTIHIVHAGNFAG
jgi:hypothetical protein